MTDSNFSWRFDNSYARLPCELFSSIKPIPVTQPNLVLFNQPLADTLGLNFKTLNDEQMAQLLAGNTLPPGSEPIAQAYAGDQFGYFNVLGDGRAILLGEHLTVDNQRLDIQLKGSGRTPYSRNGDGRAALGPMLREYIISEAMHALGIPTTRSLAVIATGEPVYRDTIQPGAILVRIAASHIRVGTFQYAAKLHNLPLLDHLLEYTMLRHFPELAETNNRAADFVNAVARRQAQLISEWMRVGFIHGVMNTDNMAISGETIDYGPCAFMDTYHANTVFSSIDSHGRYRFDQQANIAQWNLARLAEALLPLLHPDEGEAIQIGQALTRSFAAMFETSWLAMMRGKLGLVSEERDDLNLIYQLLDIMQKNQMDYTNTFLHLPHQKKSPIPALQPWLDAWQQRLQRNNASRDDSMRLMQANNPAVIPRNHQVEHALRAASVEGDLAPAPKLLNVLGKPYEANAGNESYQTPPADSERVYQTFCGT